MIKFYETMLTKTNFKRTFRKICVVSATFKQETLACQTLLTQFVTQQKSQTKFEFVNI